MDVGVFEAARAVRPYLGDLVGPAADTVDAELARLLAAPSSGGEVEVALRAVLGGHEGTRVFLERVLDDAPEYRPPQVATEPTTRYSDVPGQPSPVRADKFACPSGDFVWYRPEVDLAIPDCPTHGALRRV